MLTLLVLGVPLVWMSWENYTYEKRSDHAYARAGEIEENASTGFKEKQAVIHRAQEEQLIGIVSSVQLSDEILRPLLAGLRRSQSATQSIEPPRLWRNYHRRQLELNEAMLARWSAHANRVSYVRRFLGDKPSLQKIAALAQDDKYDEFGEKIEQAHNEVKTAHSMFVQAEPLIARRLPWGPPELEFPTRFPVIIGDFAEKISMASRCASRRLADGKLPSPECTSLLTYVQSDLTGTVGEAPTTNNGAPAAPR